MIRRRRSELRPGQIFVVERPWSALNKHEVLVVIDARSEVGFWTGEKWVVGNQMPSAMVQVL